MRPASPRRQRTPKVSINLTNCKYDLCECFTASSAPENSLPVALSCCCALLQVPTSKAVSLTLSTVLPTCFAQLTYTLLRVSVRLCMHSTVLSSPTVRVVQSQLGWLESDDADDWDVFWSDQSISLARAVAMQPMQVRRGTYLCEAGPITCNRLTC